MVAPNARAAPHKYIIVKKFKTLNSQPARNALKPDEFSWIENLMPIGNGFVPMVPGPDSAIATISTDSPGGGTVTHSLLFHFDSDLLAAGSTYSWNLGTLDTSVKKFGAGSMKVTNSSVNMSPGYHFGQHYGGPWSFQTFCRTNNFQNLNISIESASIVVNYNSAGNFISWALANNTILNRTATTTITPDTFEHIAVVRDSTASIYSLYHNGARIDVFTSTVDITDTTVGALMVASQATDTWVDEFAFSTVVEYSGTTYAVPTAAFSI